MGYAECVKEVDELLAASYARNEVPESLVVSYRTWAVLASVGVLEKSAWNLEEVRYKGVRITVGKSPTPESHIVTSEGASLLNKMSEERSYALRDTGRDPVAFELGPLTYRLFRRATAEATRYLGIAVKEVDGEEVDYIGTVVYNAPPEWCVEGACLASLVEDSVWVKVAGILPEDQKVSVFDEELDEVKTLTFMEVREHWHRVPHRIVNPSRFTRVLRLEAVLDLE